MTFYFGRVSSNFSVFFVLTNHLRYKIIIVIFLELGRFSTSANNLLHSSDKISSFKFCFTKIPSPLRIEGNLSQNWKKFKRDFENYLVISEKDDKDDQIKIDSLKNCIGEAGLNLLYSFSFTEAERKKYSVTLKKLEEYCCGSKNIIKERFKFLSSYQKEGESFNEFLIKLVSRISTCKYSYKDQEAILRDLIIVGLSDTEVQKELLKETYLTLDQTVKFIEKKLSITKNKPQEVRKKSCSNYSK